MYKHIELALQWDGYLEKASNDYRYYESKTANAGLNNYNRFSKLYDDIYMNRYGRKDGYAWCACFVCACLIEAYGQKIAEGLTYNGQALTAACTYNYNTFKRNGAFSNVPNIGDIIMFTNDNGKSANHTGFVIGIDKQYVYTIEGNTSAASGVVHNGGGVARKKYALDYKKIFGYCNLNQEKLMIVNDMHNTNDIKSNNDGGLDTIMTQEQFNTMLSTYLKQIATQDGAEWSKADREWATSNGLINGNGTDNPLWKSFITREEFAVMMHRYNTKLDK